MQPTFRALWYRYWFFGWLFRDADRGTRLEREAALRYNSRQARWLPTYMRRWATLGVLMYGVGSALESMGVSGAAIAFLTACSAAPVLAVALAGWLMLRAPATTVVRPRRDG